MKKKTLPPSTAPAALGVLKILTGFLSVSALAGGFGLISDPSGGRLRFSQDIVERNPFPSFLIPGLFLLFVFGVGGAFVLWALWKRPPWTLWNGSHPSRCLARLLGVILIVWIIVQIAMIGYQHILQPFYGFMGIAMVMFATLRPVNKYLTEK